MNRKFIIITVLFFSIFIGTVKVFGFAKDRTRILFILDCSLSMENELGKSRRMDVAKSLLTGMVDSLSKIKDIDLAFRAYGHRSPTIKQDCKDTRLEVGFEPDNAYKIKDVIKKLQPKGTTPIAYSLSQTIYDFPDKKAQNIVILITDGAEECKGNPCAVSKQLQEAGIVLRPFIIGIALTPDLVSSYDCVGSIYNATTEDDFRKVLKQVVRQALDKTTAQLNLINTTKLPVESDLTFSYKKVGEKTSPEFHFQTLTQNQIPDSFKIGGGSKYNFVAYSTPIQSFMGETSIGIHNVIPFNLSTGTAQFIQKGFEGFKNPYAVFKEKSSKKEFLALEENSTHRIVCGTYNYSALSFPIRKNEIGISTSKSSILELEMVGKLEIKSGNDFYFDILEKLSSGKTKSLWGIKSISMNELYSSYLLPGEYFLIYQNKDSKNTEDSKSVPFIVKSGKVNSIKF